MRDLSWLEFAAVAMTMSVAGFLFDERYSPMGDVALPEKILWYAGYGSGFLVMPGLVVLLIHLVSKRSGRGMKRPKLATVGWGVSIMFLTLGMTALRVSS
jgi:hypothetical protein